MKIVNLPALPEKGDVSDWIAAGGTPEELKRLASEAPEWNLLKNTSDGNEQAFRNYHPSSDPLGKLRELSKGASFVEIGDALRDLSESLNDIDELSRQMAREEAIPLLKKLAVSRPAGLIDAVLQRKEA